MKKYIAEFIGTFGLTLAVLGSLSVQGSLPTVLVAGITLGLFVATIGIISGAHINPAVTIGAWSLKKIDHVDAILYILAQFAGAALAMLLGRMNSLGGALPSDFSWVSIGAEFVGTIIFTFGIASIVLSKGSAEHTASRAPFVIGGSLTLGASLALALGSNAVLNPAVAFGIGSFGIAYIVGPILGSLAGMWLYKVLAN
jgi:aquaporin Z